jgi:hypothetical protein
MSIMPSMFGLGEDQVPHSGAIHLQRHDVVSVITADTRVRNPETLPAPQDRFP